MKYRAILFAGFALLGATLPVRAHHSFAAEYTVTKPVTLTGGVMKIEWTNPHAHLYLEVRDRDGKVANWEFELSSPSAMMRQGWTRNALKPGDSITVTGYVAREGGHRATASSVTMSGGRRLFVRYSGDSEAIH